MGRTGARIASTPPAHSRPPPQHPAPAVGVSTAPRHSTMAGANEASAASPSSPPSAHSRQQTAARTVGTRATHAEATRTTSTRPSTAHHPL
eukprot:6730660-Prymnesium_polylepis.2